VISQAVVVVPTLLPNITANDCLNVSNPASTNATVIDVTALLDCSIPVKTAPSKKAFTLFEDKDERRFLRVSVFKCRISSLKLRNPYKNREMVASTRMSTLKLLIIFLADKTRKKKQLMLLRKLFLRPHS
jgi:hypothetical protein